MRKAAILNNISKFCHALKRLSLFKELRERLRLRVFTRRHTHTFYNCNIYVSNYLQCNNVEFVLHLCESLQRNIS